VTGEGETAGMVRVPAGRKSVLARAVRELLDGAAASRHDGRRVTQLHAALAGGDVFAVTGANGQAIVAIVKGPAAPGLFFYDLKRCLAALGEEWDGAA